MVKVRVKFPLCVTKVHAMLTQGEVSIGFIVEFL
jgi:hypothetical protein